MALGKYPNLADVPSLRTARKSVPGAESPPELRRDVPLLNGVQFAIRTHSEGGASFDTSTNQFMEAGKHRVYVVGGEQDTKGQRIPTKQVPQVDVPTASEHIAHVREATGNRAGAIAGSWVAPGRVDLDAATGFRSRSHALKVAHARNEEAIWDNAAGDEVLTKHGKKARGLT